MYHADIYLLLLRFLLFGISAYIFFGARFALPHVALLSSLRRVRALSLDMALAHTRSRISLWLTSPLSTDYSTLGSKQGNIVLFKVSHCVINYGHQGKCSEDFDSIPGASTLSGKQPAHTD